MDLRVSNIHHVNRLTWKPLQAGGAFSLISGKMILHLIINVINALNLLPHLQESWHVNRGEGRCGLVS